MKMLSPEIVPKIQLNNLKKLKLIGKKLINKMKKCKITRET